MTSFATPDWASDDDDDGVSEVIVDNWDNECRQQVTEGKPKKEKKRKKKKKKSEPDEKPKDSPKSDSEEKALCQTSDGSLLRRGIRFESGKVVFILQKLVNGLRCLITFLDTFVGKQPRSLKPSNLARKSPKRTSLNRMMMLSMNPTATPSNLLQVIHRNA